MENVKKQLMRIKMFSLIQGVMLTIVGMTLLITHSDMIITTYLLIIAWGGFFVVTTGIARVMKSL